MGGCGNEVARTGGGISPRDAPLLETAQRSGAAARARHPMATGQHARPSPARWAHLALQQRVDAAQLRERDLPRLPHAAAARGRARRQARLGAQRGVVVG